MSSNRDFKYEIPWPPVGNRPGHHESLARGGGFRFREHMPLLRDPDARRIDLHATLRDPFGDIQVRTFKERRAIVVYVLADVSASMGFGDKWRTLTDFSAAAAYSAYRTGDAFAFQGAGRRAPEPLRLAPSRSRGQADLIEARLQGFAPDGDSSEGFLSAAQAIGRQRALIFVVSDFHCPVPLITTLLASLAAHAVVPVIVWDRSEFTVPQGTGWYEARDLESGLRRTVILRRRWRNTVQGVCRQRQDTLRALFSDAGTSPLALSAPFDVDQVTEFFAGGGGWRDVAM